MSKWIIAVVVFVLGYIAYSGIDVTSQYEKLTSIRDDAMHLGDPLVKDGLERLGNSNFDKVVDGTIKKIVNEVSD